MDYGQRCGGAFLIGEVFVAESENLHVKLKRMSGRLRSAQLFDDQQKPSIKAWFDVDNRPGFDIPANKQNHSIPRSKRKPDRMLWNGLYYKRVHPNQPALFWLFEWEIYTKNNNNSVTWSEDFAIACGKEPYFEDHEWRESFTLTFSVLWNQPKSRASFSMLTVEK